MWEAFAWVGLVLELFGIFLAGKRRIGWLVALCGATLWLPYAIDGHWPVMASTILFGSVYAKNWVINKHG